jgi:uncharacterized protein YcaQ
MTSSLKELREQAISTSLFRPGTLRQAVERLGFVQADPIRSPARAQDLILRQRVKDYRVGDLEREYERLRLEEDRLYAHGFMPLSTWHLLHPPTKRRLSSLEKKVLEFTVARKRIHPRDLEVHFGRKLTTNAWGGQSKATTHALHRLHASGLLRVAGREKGIRVYAPVTRSREEFDRPERFARLALLIASILGPLSDKSLRTALVYTQLKGGSAVVPQLIESGELAHAVVDGVRYVWPKQPLSTRANPNRTVRFLAPFDPLVWDRQRFEHFWGWQYRFEAYTPAPRRQLGYYAMPMLWRSDMIGWVNITKQGIVKPGFKNAPPTDEEFRVEFDAEVSRFQTFLTRPKSL